MILKPSFSIKSIIDITLECQENQERLLKKIGVRTFLSSIIFENRKVLSPPDNLCIRKRPERIKSGNFFKNLEKGMLDNLQT